MTPLPQTIHALDAGQTLTLAPGRGQRLRVIAGRLWVTQSGRPDDHFLSAGHSLTLDSPGHVVAQAEGAVRTKADDILSLYVLNRQGGKVPLSSLIYSRER